MKVYEHNSEQKKEIDLEPEADLGAGKMSPPPSYLASQFIWKIVHI